VVLALGTAALVAFGIGVALRPVVHHPRRQAEVDQVRTELASRYYRRLSKNVLAKPTVPGLLGALHDSYTTYLSPAQYRLARRAVEGGYGGIGVTVLPAPGGLLVRRMMNGPARVAGILPGDTIMSVTVRRRRRSRSTRRWGGSLAGPVAP
jgi:C-terminal processing protease CtpA/Prc